MSKNIENPPVFPQAKPAYVYDEGSLMIKQQEGQIPYLGGMSLRDYFAASALQEFIKISRDNYNYNLGAPEEADFDWVARVSYQQADAMLKARTK